MNKSCRGIACIINIFKVHGMEERNGTDVDRDRLKQLFEQLHFGVKVFNDADDLRAEVSCLSVTSAVCCFSSQSIYTAVYDIASVFVKNFC